MSMQPSPGGGASAPPPPPPAAPPSGSALPPSSSQQNSNFKMPIPETLDRVKEEFAYLQAQNQK